MKKVIIVLGVFLLVSLLSLAGVSCKSEEPAATLPAKNGGVPEVLLEVSCDKFMQQKHIAKQIEVIYPGSLIVSLCSNPTTGFQWNESTQISDPSVLQQYSHSFVAPQPRGALGAPGKDVWTFKTLNKGTSTISLEYSRPWEGGEKREWTYTLTVIVK